MVTRVLLSMLAILVAGVTMVETTAAADLDNSPMILIPAGPFTMGSPGKAVDEDAAERPPHEVTLPAYYIDKCEVTTAQYAAFLNATGKLQDGAGRPFVWQNEDFQLQRVGDKWQPKAGLENYPMVFVTWYGALAYAQWAGKRLPTEAEWEKAARGTDSRRYPWGNDFDQSRMIFGQDKLGPVGSRPNGASPFGVLDMAGNAWEWTSSLFKPYPYDAKDGREDPQAEGRRVARGGSWTGEPFIATTTYRFRPEPGFAHSYLGFRCAKNAQ